MLSLLAWLFLLKCLKQSDLNVAGSLALGLKVNKCKVEMKRGGKKKNVNIVQS